MEYKDFKVGDRVEAINAISRLRGEQGTVVALVEKGIGVRLDKKIGIHACRGNCENGYGWWFDSDELTLIDVTQKRQTAPAIPDPVTAVLRQLIADGKPVEIDGYRVTFAKIEDKE